MSFIHTSHGMAKWLECWHWVQEIMGSNPACCNANFDIKIHSNFTSINKHQVALICDVHLKKVHGHSKHLSDLTPGLDTLNM